MNLLQASNSKSYLKRKSIGHVFKVCRVMKVRIGAIVVEPIPGAGFLIIPSRHSQYSEPIPATTVF